MATGVAVVNGSAAELPVVPSRLSMPKQDGKHALLKAFVRVLRMVTADAGKAHATRKEPQTRARLRINFAVSWYAPRGKHPLHTVATCASGQRLRALERRWEQLSPRANSAKLPRISSR